MQCLRLHGYTTAISRKSHSDASARRTETVRLRSMLATILLERGAKHTYDLTSTGRRAKTVYLPYLRKKVRLLSQNEFDVRPDIHPVRW